MKEVEPSSIAQETVKVAQPKDQEPSVSSKVDVKEEAGEIAEGARKAEEAKVVAVN